jgi:hypothetical protein
MAEASRRERRGHVRGLISIKAKVTPIDPAKAKGLLPSGAEPPAQESGAPGTQAARAGGHQGPPDWAVHLARQLAGIEDKLDRLLEKLECEGAPVVATAIADTKDISGSGIGLVLTGPIQKGQLIEISMALPGMPVGTFRAYGEVVRVSARSGKDSGLFDVAVKFLNISETERDQLIACSFAAQRRSIRNASEDADDQ